ncbi:MAG: metallophosphoesterase [Myxococcales bacterium]|nr:metallophosphoesterase [Myxococcales bacterium]
MSTADPHQPPERPNYLLLSDVHLGGDLVQHAAPWTAGRLGAELALDRKLSALLAHYRRERDPERPWTLVIAGDLVDFVGMSVSARDPSRLSTPLTEEEHSHGLGSAADHAAEKMRRVAERHPTVFRALAEFVADGHALLIVRGNHDVEFYWEPAQRAFIDALVDALVGLQPELQRDAEARAAFEQRIEFRHWFYYRDDLLYVEHGHQYDEACAYTHVLAPRSPRDPRRLDYSFSDILLRFVVRPTRGLGCDGHETTSLFFYLRLAFSMGIGGCLSLGYRFFSAVFEMIRVWRDHLDERARALRAEHERRMALVAERFSLQLDKVRALSALSAKPVTRRFSAILRAVFLDLIAVGLGAAVLLLVVAGFRLLPPLQLGLLASLIAAGFVLWLKRPRAFDSTQALRAGAEAVAKVLPARFIVMGHTHVPVMESVAEESVYINLGAWAVDDLEEFEVAPAPCTYLVIRQQQAGPVAELRRWDAEQGPVLLQTTFAPLESGVHLRPLDRPEDERAA